MNIKNVSPQKTAHSVLDYPLGGVILGAAEDTCPPALLTFTDTPDQVCSSLSLQGHFVVEVV